MEGKSTIKHRPPSDSAHALVILDRFPFESESGYSSSCSSTISKKSENPVNSLTNHNHFSSTNIKTHNMMSSSQSKQKNNVNIITTTRTTATEITSGVMERKKNESYHNNITINYKDHIEELKEPSDEIIVKDVHETACQKTHDKSNVLTTTVLRKRSHSKSNLFTDNVEDSKSDMFKKSRRKSISQSVTASRTSAYNIKTRRSSCFVDDSNQIVLIKDPVKLDDSTISLQREQREFRMEFPRNNVDKIIFPRGMDNQFKEISQRQSTSTDKNITEYIQELRPSSPILYSPSKNMNKQRRQSHCVERINPIANIDKKKITRRKSVYVEAITSKTCGNNIFNNNNNHEDVEVNNHKSKLRRSRRDSCLMNDINMKNCATNESKIEFKRPRRQSVCYGTIETKIPLKKNCKEIFNISIKNNHEISQRSVKTMKMAPNKQEVKNDEIIEEVIEEVWFVTLFTINKKSVMKFLIKWEGHPPTENTYEPLEHIRHCDVLVEYVERKFSQHQDKIDELSAKLLDETREQYNSYLRRSKASIIKKMNEFDEIEFKCSLLAYIYTYDGEILAHFKKKLRFQNVLYQFYQKWKNEKDKNLILLETIMSEENYSFELTTENNVDYEPIPNFEYLSKVNFPPNNASIINVGCNCKKKCNKNSLCCPKLKGWEFVYSDIDGRICIKEHQMIVECNNFCSCDRNCPNKPKPITIKMCIFKTQNRGWGVKTLENIPMGKFVIEYTGEFLNKNEARKRARIYHKTGNTYLFDLDYNEKGIANYSTDATYQGNISRFINHSCNANLQTWPATSCHQDPRMHKLYYFSQRYIRAGEELTVDYTGGRGKILPESYKGDEDVVGDHGKCLCGSTACRGYIF